MDTLPVSKVNRVVDEIQNYYHFKDVILGGLSISTIYKIYNKLPFFTHEVIQTSDFLQKEDDVNLQKVIEYYGLTPEHNNIDMDILKQMAVQMTKDTSSQTLKEKIGLKYTEVKHMMNELEKRGLLDQVISLADLVTVYKSTERAPSDPQLHQQPQPYQQHPFGTRTSFGSTVGGNKIRRRNKRTHKKYKTKKHI